MANLSDDDHADDLARTVAAVYAEYQRRLRAANALDFDDLIGETVAVLQAFPQIAQHYRRRFRHILVDEYQDTNHAQYVLVRELVGRDAGDEPDGVPPAELCVVGDADQSIYAFRGATIRNIEDFERDYPNATTILLEQNYRSTQNILSAANSVISRNSGRREKRLWTDAGEGELIVGYVADNEHDEARFVAEEIDALADRRRASPTTTWRFSTAPTTRRGRWKRCSSAPAFRTKSLGACGFTSARRFATSSPTCGCWTTPATRSACGASSTRRAAASVIAPRLAWRCTPRTPVPVSPTRCEAAAEGKVPMLNTRSAKAIAGFVEMLDDLRGRLDARPRGAGRGGAGAHRIPRGAWNPPPTRKTWPGWTTSTNSSASHTNSPPTWRTPPRSTRPSARPTTKTCRTPVCWRSSWNGCRWSPTPMKSPSTAPVWSR